MKKIIKICILLFFVIVFLQILSFIFKTKHEVSYVINNEKENLFVNETYKNKKYYFKVKWNKEDFIFQVDNSYYKNKKIVKDIKYYKKEDLSCIYPIFQDDSVLDIICTKDNILGSYTYYKKEVSNFVIALQKMGYSNKSWENTDSKTKLGSITVYKQNLIEDSYIYIWKYNGFYSLNKKEVKPLNIFDKDTYINDLGVLVDKYYIIPDYNQEYDFNKIYIYNITTNKYKTIELKKDISRDSYINGIVDNKLYIFDKDNLVQYKIDPKKRSIEVVGDTEDNGIYYDGVWQERNIYDFKNNKIIFEEEKDIPKIINNTTYIYKEDNNYYYLTENNNFYQYNLITKNKVLLFNFKDIKNIIVNSENIYFIKGDTLYVYNKVNGLKKIVTYEEFSFNTENIYSVYKG